MLISIIVPVFNEESSVQDVIRRVLSLALPPGDEMEIIVVDDGSTDGTSHRLAALPPDPRVRLHYSVLNFGKGVAVRIGLRYAKGDVVVIQDADLEYDPAQILQLIEPIRQGETPVVFGSRFLGQAKWWTFLQNIGNRILTLCINLLYGARITDAYTCYKIMRGDVARGLKLKARGFELEAEITSQLLKMRLPIKEIPIVYEARTFKEGKKIRAWDGVKGILWMLYYRIGA